MPTNFIFRFEKANLFIPFQMPNKRQRQAAVNRQTTPEDAKRSSVIARMEKIKDQLQIPESCGAKPAQSMAGRIL